MSFLNSFANVAAPDKFCVVHRDPEYPLLVQGRAYKVPMFSNGLPKWKQRGPADFARVDTILGRVAVSGSMVIS